MVGTGRFVGHRLRARGTPVAPAAEVGAGACVCGWGDAPVTDTEDTPCAIGAAVFVSLCCGGCRVPLPLSPSPRLGSAMSTHSGSQQGEPVPWVEFTHFWLSGRFYRAPAKGLGAGGCPKSAFSPRGALWGGG